MEITEKVKAWRAKEIIPTYEVGNPEKYPVFLEKRVYQGSSGVIYPNPIIEKISDTKIDKVWDVIYLENAFLKIMIIPALGGRIQMAFDKIRERHFVYYNHVIKPALVGVAGPWIAGGIEFNWPQHHRPSTYSPCESFIEKNEDGSVTVWVNEIERMFRTKGMAGFSLFPDKAYLEVKGQLYNRTPHPQTFLWWANPAVKVNDKFKSVFPPDVSAVFDHGKRDVSEFPIAKGKYYKVDYSPGTDISLYKNIPVPTSYMVFKSDYDFVGGYEGDTQGGLLHVADHHISPGKKLWTWGNSDFGDAWTRNLTDDDGPYIELMCGVYTDNQPDFSWLHPYEERTFKQYFMPYYGVGDVKNATKEALLNIEFKEGKTLIKVYVTSFYPKSKIRLYRQGELLFEDIVDLDPQNIYSKELDLEGIQSSGAELVLVDQNDGELVSWEEDSVRTHEVPEAAKPAKSPEEIESTEQLYLTGLHLEQYRHATYDPTSYYKEALNRDPGDSRNNNALGLWFLKRGKFKKALSFFNAAIETLTERNPNPYNGEPYFNKGIAHRFLDELDESYTAFYKATWNSQWQDAAFLNLAQIDSLKGNFLKALELIDKSIVKNWHNNKSRFLKVALLRQMHKEEEARILIEESLNIDKFNFGVLFEKYLISKSPLDRDYFEEMMRDDPHNYLEVSIDYANFGFYNDAVKVLKIYLKNKDQVYPMVHYFMAFYYEKMGETHNSEFHYERAREMPIDYCFPSRLEEVVVLKTALSRNEKDVHASYFLGNFWYASKQYEDAKECWLASLKNGGGANAICHRNLALYYFNKAGEKELALQEMEEAFSIDSGNPRALFELDQLYKKMNVPVQKRLELLSNHIGLTEERDDLYIELVSLYNFKGEHEEAIKLIRKRNFHPWEGGEGRVPLEWLTAKTECAKKHLNTGNTDRAIEYLKSTASYPHNLGEGKLPIAGENDIYYWLGAAYEIIGNRSLAQKCWEKSAGGPKDFSLAMYYNDEDPGRILYQGLSLIKLGRVDEAETVFKAMIDYGNEHLEDKPQIDYFAVSLPDFLIWEEDLVNRNKVHCHYMIGLGHIGLRENARAKENLKKALDLDLYHLGCRVHLNMLETGYRLFK